MHCSMPDPTAVTGLRCSMTHSAALYQVLPHLRLQCAGVLVWHAPAVLVDVRIPALGHNLLRGA